MYVGFKELGFTTTLLGANAILFDGFETGDTSALDWSISGVPAWNIDETNPYDGSYSAHVKTTDILNGKESKMDLHVSLEKAVFIQFYFNAPVAMPFESLELYVDGSFLTPLTTPDSEWTPAGAIVPSGDHTISWRYANNPGGLPGDALGNIPKPAYRLAEAWLDNVSLLPLTDSFLEDWESQDFSVNNWILSGDADWAITNTNTYEGSYSATVASTDIAEASGSAKLSIDLITENGGTLTYWIMPLVTGPSDAVQVLVNNDIVATYSKAETSWVAKEIKIRPGKREITFEFLKEDGGNLGHVWLDNIQFSANE